MFMYSAAVDAPPVPRPQAQNQNVVVRVHFDARRCVAPPEALDSHAIVERALSGTQLDSTTRDEMVRILTVTVQQWLHR